MKFNNFAKEYFDNIKKLIGQIDIDKLEQIKDVLLSAYQKNKKIFIFGNGGSAAAASHFACDLGKGTVKDVNDLKRFKVISLTDNLSTITALGNDISYDDIFVEQVKNLIEEDDIAIGISASGSSKNVLKAIEFANKVKAVTIGFIGFDGGKLKNITNYNIIVPNFHYGIVEDFHLIFEHIICYFLKELKNEERKN